MKDRIEFRFTIATGKLESKALQVFGKAIEKKLDRMLESVTKAIETIVDSEVEKQKGQKED